MTKVGLAYDLVDLDYLNGRPFDCFAELDSKETIQAVEAALVSGGHEVIHLEANQDFAEKLKSTGPEIVFNIAEGRQGDCRESQVPAICEFYGVPYTGSGVLALSMCLNKAITSRVLSSHGILVPPSQVFYSRDETLLLSDGFPMIVKLLHEGSSMGLSRKSVVMDEGALREQVEFVIGTYRQPALVQKFLTGREFNIGILGNTDPVTLPITEVTFSEPYGIVTFTPDDEMLPMLESRCGEKFMHDLLSQGIPRRSVCPAEIPPELADQIRQTAIKAFKVMDCRDWCRIDFRLGDDGKLYLLELNPIAGIAPGYWMPNSAAVAHLDYVQLINIILNIAWKRIDSNHHYGWAFSNTTGG
jgi:D-alanine-D-alanine ligase